MCRIRRTSDIIGSIWQRLSWCTVRPDNRWPRKGITRSRMIQRQGAGMERLLRTVSLNSFYSVNGCIASPYYYNIAEHNFSENICGHYREAPKLSLVLSGKGLFSNLTPLESFLGLPKPAPPSLSSNVSDILPATKKIWDTTLFFCSRWRR